MPKTADDLPISIESIRTPCFRLMPAVFVPQQNQTEYRWTVFARLFTM
ncbi:hypothetical protein [Idiomarina sp.]